MGMSRRHRASPREGIPSTRVGPSQRGGVAPRTEEEAPRKGRSLVGRRGEAICVSTSESKDPHATLFPVEVANHHCRMTIGRD
eukprot:8112790-Pyramimonas_sp.AAC.1